MNFCGPYNDRGGADHGVLQEQLNALRGTQRLERAILKEAHRIALETLIRNHQTACEALDRTHQAAQDAVHETHRRNVQQARSAQHLSVPRIDMPRVERYSEVKWMFLQWEGAHRLENEEIDAFQKMLELIFHHTVDRYTINKIDGQDRQQDHVNSMIYGFLHNVGDRRDVLVGFYYYGHGSIRKDGYNRDGFTLADRRSTHFVRWAPMQSLFTTIRSDLVLLFDSCVAGGAPNDFNDLDIDYTDPEGQLPNCPNLGILAATVSVNATPGTGQSSFTSRLANVMSQIRQTDQAMTTALIWEKLRDVYNVDGSDFNPFHLALGGEQNPVIIESKYNLAHRKYHEEFETAVNGDPNWNLGQLGVGEIRLFIVRDGRKLDGRYTCGEMPILASEHDTIRTATQIYRQSIGLLPENREIRLSYGGVVLHPVWQLTRLRAIQAAAQITSFQLKDTFVVVAAIKDDENVFSGMYTGCIEKYSTDGTIEEHNCAEE